MPNILTPIGQSFTDKPNIAATYGPYASIAAAHAALSDDNMNIIGMTFGIRIDANTIDEYWYQGGTTEQHIVKKQLVEDIPASALAGDIPASKLSSGVQTSLGKADTAFQKPGTGIPASDLASAVQTSLGKADTAFQKPGTGIPESDLASAVQTSLGKADTAVQPADIAALDGNPSGTSADGHVSVQVTEVDGVVNAVNVTTNDIASASALAGEVSRAQGAESALDAAKADKATTLYGYGITNAYTKSEVDGLVSTPHQNYVTVADYASLPATGSDDTIYRVSCWDGAYNSGAGQVDDSKYTEYAWNGSAYVLLRVMSATAEVFDISAYNNATYDDLTDALGVSGANVPADLRAGGMSVKFIKNDPATYTLTKSTESSAPSGTTYTLTTDPDISAGTYDASALSAFNTVEALPSSIGSEKVYVYDDRGSYIVYTIAMNTAETSHYEQYRLVSATWSTAVSDWQGVDSSPSALSKGLLESGGTYNSIRDVAIKTDSLPLETTPVNLVTSGDGQTIFNGYVATNGNTGSTSQSTYQHLKVDVTGYNYVRFLGYEYSKGYSFTRRGYAFYNSGGSVISGTAKAYDEGTGSKGRLKEYFVKVPTNAKYFKTNAKYDSYGLSLNNFYCNLLKGDDVKSYVDKNVAQLNTDIAATDAIAKDADGIVIRSTSVTFDSAPSSNAYLIYQEALSIPAGKKLRIKVSGIGTVASSYMYKINSGSFVQKITDNIIYLDTVETVTKFYVAISPDSYMAAGTMTAEVDVYGVSTGMIEDIDALKTATATNGTDINSTNLKAFGGTLGSYEGHPKRYDTQGSTIELSGVVIPVGGKLHITAEGIGTAISAWSYKINDNTAVSTTDSLVEINIQQPITYIRIYTTNAQIIDSEQDVSITLEYIGMEQALDKVKDDIIDLHNEDYKIEGAEIFAYSGHPISSAVSSYIDRNDLVYPSGTYRITFNGVGTAIKKWSYRINGVTYANKSYASVDVDLEELTQLKIWTAPANILDYDANVSIAVKYLGLLEDLWALTEKVNNAGGLRDFTTQNIVDRFSTDDENNEFAESFSFNIEKEGHTNDNMLVSAYAKFVNDVDDSVPTILFTYKNSGNTNIYVSPAYTIGKKDEFAQKEWRVPAFPKNCNLTITVSIPTNVTLYMEEFSNRYSDAVDRNTAGFRMNAHTNLYGNFNNLNAFELSAKVGYPCCIAVPKRTYDGVWVCFHDDSHIGDTLVDENYEPLTEPESTYSISNLTYARLKQLSYKQRNGEYLKVPTLEDFFMVCAKTGMHPMFSCHPVPNETQFREIKALANKFGLLPYLNIKMAFSGDSSVQNMARAYSVFGDAIESYTADVNVDTDIATIITAFDTVNIDKTKVRAGIEFFDSKVTVEKVQATLEAGYFAAIAWMQTTNPTSKVMEYWIKNGVTEFTDYRNFSNGLNW